MRRLSVLVLALLFAATSTTADDCDIEWYYDEASQQWTYIEVCYPEYYVWQYVEPDWCIYAHGSEVLTSPQYQTPTAWYVTPPSDPGRDGDYFVNNNHLGCMLIPYPW